MPEDITLHVYGEVIYGEVIYRYRFFESGTIMPDPFAAPVGPVFVLLGRDLVGGGMTSLSRE